MTMTQTPANTDPIAVAVAAEMERRGLSIREIGRLTGVSYPTVSRWLQGVRGIPPESMRAILAELGLEIVVRRAKGGR
jgi:transcriptional regulator with XRE-family HTH domain